MKSILCVVAALAFVGSAVADTINVPAGGDIQAAIDGASNGDIIQLEAGEYFPAATINTLGKAVTLRGEVGKGKDGAPTTVIDGQDSIRVLICENGEGADTVFENLLITGGYTSGSGGGMFNYNSNPTLTNCAFENNSAFHSGGGMYCYSCRPRLTNCTFTGNSVTGTSGIVGGGGMFNTYSSPTLTNCTFTGNSATGAYGRGGGMYNYNISSPTLTDCTFTNNSATSYGGGMSNLTGSSPTLENCAFEGNSAGYAGGGMNNSVSFSPTLANTTLCGNSPDQVYGSWTDNGGNCLSFSCTDDDGDGVPDKCGGKGGGILLVPSEYPTIELAIAAAAYGDVIEIAAGTYHPTETLNTQGKPITLRGAISKDGQPATIIDGQDSIRVLICENNEGADTVFENLLITGGYTTYNGGGMYNWNNSSPTLENCTFVGNSADDDGGGMNNSGSSPTLTGCTFTGNSADSGGGMYNLESSPTLNDCTFTGNSATGWDRGGGGMSNHDNSSPTLEDCTFTGNTAISGGGISTQEDCSLILSGCTFEENSANFGGALSNKGCFGFGCQGTILATGCAFIGNVATTHGGAIYGEEYASVSLVDCVFTSNSDVDSYAVYNYLSSATLSNCVFDRCCAVFPITSAIDMGGNHTLYICDVCEGDVTCDGKVDAADLGRMLAAWGPSTGRFDLNADGEVSGADLGLLIGTWGVCP